MIKDFILGLTNRIIIAAIGAVGIIFQSAPGIQSDVPALRFRDQGGKTTFEAKISGNLRGSGSITAKSGSLATALLSDGRVTLNNITYRFPYSDGTATGKVLKTSAAGQLSWSTDIDTGGSTNTGGILDSGNSRFVNVSGDSMTGGLIIKSGNPSATIDSGLLLEIIGTASGRIVHAQDQLRSSGSLIVEGAVTFATALTVPNGGTGFGSCTDGGFITGNATATFTCNAVLGDDVIYVGDGTTEPTEVTLPSCSGASDTLNYNTGTNAFACGTDADTTYTAGQGLTLTSTTFSTNATLTGSLVRFTTISGSTIFAKNTLTSSGSLEVLGTASGGQIHASSQLRSSGALTIQGVTILRNDLTLGGGNLNFTEGTTIGDNGDQITLDSNGTLVINDGTINLSNQTVGVTLNSAANALNFDSNTLSIDALNNRVGIGTATPIDMFDVNGTLTTSAGSAISGFYVVSRYPTLGFNTYSSSYLAGATGFGGVLQFDNTNGDLIYYAGTNVSAGDAHANTARFIIKDSGLVGIGNIAPSVKLHVTGSGAFTSRLAVGRTLAKTALEVSGTISGSSLTVGGSSTVQLGMISSTATLDFANLASIGCEDLTITVNGASTGDVVALGIPNGSVVNHSNYTAWVSSDNTVTVRFCALISGDPASGVFRAEVRKF